MLLFVIYEGYTMSMLIGFVNPAVVHQRLPDPDAAKDPRDTVAYLVMCLALACCLIFLAMLWTPVIYVNDAR